MNRCKTPPAAAREAVYLWKVPTCVCVNWIAQTAGQPSSGMGATEGR